MAGLNFLNLRTALGGFMTGWDDAKTKAQKEQQEQIRSLAALEALQDVRGERRGRQLAGGLLSSGYVPGGGDGFSARYAPARDAVRR